jgi:hypothetical protein
MYREGTREAIMIYKVVVAELKNTKSKRLIYRACAIQWELRGCIGD